MDLSSDVAAVAFGLASAVSWGAGDFSGGLATKRTNVYGVTVFSQIAGLLLFIMIALLRGEASPSSADIVWSAAAGWVGVFGLIAFYRALAVGRMGIAAPVSAVVTAAFPVAVGVLTQGLPGTLQVVGFGLALLGVWFLARPDASADGRPDGFGLALLAGLGFGGFLVLIHQAEPNHVFWPLAVARCASLGLMIGVATRTQKDWLPPRKLFWLILLCGILDAGGNAFFVIAGQLGRLDVASILASLYPATTVLLATLILRERLTRVQMASIGFVLVAIVLITARRF
ncbi:MAG TPA: DMT family transporter [Aggregatilineales bacterium]|nr:DMT family transporter [Aggregatilineales bacterium]